MHSKPQLASAEVNAKQADMLHMIVNSHAYKLHPVDHALQNM